MSEKPLAVTRAQIITRGLLCACPNCGKHGLHKNLIKLREDCRHCALPLRMEEGFYSATTSIGYVLIIAFVIIPVVVLAVLGKLTELQAILIGSFGAIAFTALIYPALLAWVLANYYTWFPEQLPVNGGKYIRNETR